MIRPFTGVVMLQAVLAAGWAASAAARRPAAGSRYVLGLVGLQVLVVVHAGMAALSLAGGHQPARPGTHLAYVGASLLVLPLLLGTPGGDGPWRAAVATLGCVAVAVILSRMWVTWQPVA